MTKPFLLLFAFFALAMAGSAAAHPSRFHTQAVENEEAMGSMTDIKTRGEEIRTKISEYRAAAVERRLALAKEVCTKMADQRIRAVNAVKTKVSNSGLTTEQKNELIAAVEAVLSDLNTYKAECTNATTVEEVKSIIKKIKDKHVFRWFMPRAHALRSLDRTIGFIGRLNNHVATMQKHLNKAKEAGCDTAGAETALADYQKAVSAAQTYLNEAKAIVGAINPNTDPGSTRRSEIKERMRLMVNSLKDARDAHKKFIAELKECRKSTKAETEPAEPTESTPEPSM